MMSTFIIDRLNLKTSTTDVLEKSSCTCGFMPDIYYTVSITGHIAPITDYY